MPAFCKATDDASKLVRPRRVSGILDDRLTQKQKKKWQAMQSVVFAQNDAGDFIHPTLARLWTTLDTSGNKIFIEFPDCSSYVSGTAGTFRIEELDPEGKSHIAVIRLYLRVIDTAVVDSLYARKNGFLPFAGLERNERYVEVLGHELAHAVDILSDPVRAKQVKEVVDRTNDLLLSHIKRKELISPESDLHRRLHERDVFLEELESHAEAAEEDIWRELIAVHTKGQSAQ
jgi:hypothetical protein